MASPFSSPQFLRLVRKPLLREYFHQKGLLLNFDFEQLGDTEIAPIHEAIQGLPGEIRAQVDSDFHAVHDLGTATGQVAIVHAARSQGVAFPDEFGSIKDTYEQAFRCLLEHPDVFDLALRFWDADTLRQADWVRRPELPVVKPDRSDIAINALRVNLQSHFLQKEGRGYNCYIECYPREGDLYCYVYLEDHGRSDLEFVEGEGPPQRRHRRPVFSIVFVYSPGKERLDTNYRGSRRDTHELQRLFAFAMLNILLDPICKASRVYNLERLKERAFAWVVEPSWNIKRVVVKRLRLSVQQGINKHITLTGDTRRKADVVYDLLDDAFAPGQTLRLTQYHVTQAEIKVEFNNTYRRKSLPFTLTAPDRCTLGLDGDDRNIGRCWCVQESNRADRRMTVLDVLGELLERADAPDEEADHFLVDDTSRSIPKSTWRRFQPSGYWFLALRHAQFSSGLFRRALG